MDPSEIRASDALDQRVRELARGGRKIDAIKLVREEKGLGLKEAREYVERIEPSARSSNVSARGCLVVVAALLALIVWLLMR